MKSILFFLFFLFYLPVFAQSIAKIDSGAVNGAKYRITFSSNWNEKKLVMYTDGYEFMGA